MTLLSTKCNMKKEDVEKSYDEFNLKYKDGFIQKDEYIRSMKVRNVIFIFHLTVLSRTRWWRSLCSACLTRTRVGPWVLRNIFRSVLPSLSEGPDLDDCWGFQATQVGEFNTVEDKLAWIFTAFDADGGGSIDHEEIYDICEGLFRLAGIEDDPDLLASCVSDVRWWHFLSS